LNFQIKNRFKFIFKMWAIFFDINNGKLWQLMNDLCQNKSLVLVKSFDFLKKVFFYDIVKNNNFDCSYFNVDLNLKNLSFFILNRPYSLYTFEHFNFNNKMLDFFHLIFSLHAAIFIGLKNGNEIINAKKLFVECNKIKLTWKIKWNIFI
jgi:hypothetical protein